MTREHVPHIAGCRNRFRDHDDAAKRIADAVNKHTQGAALGIVWETVQGKWMGFNLNDGRSDGVLYDTKRDAARHTDEMTHFYVKLRADYMTACEAAICLALHRKGRAAGFPQADPDSKTGGSDIIPRIGTSEVRQQVQALIRGK